MQPFQERVVDEKSDLDKKLSKLKEFTAGKLFAELPSDEQGRLNRQQSIMEDYSAVLGARIAAFQPV